MAWGMLTAEAPCHVGGCHCVEQRARRSCKGSLSHQAGTAALLHPPADCSGACGQSSAGPSCTEPEAGQTLNTRRCPVVSNTAGPLLAPALLTVKLKGLSLLE